MKIDPNAPAFPSCQCQLNPFRGLTIRAHFAAMAMQGLCANPAFNDAPVSQVIASAIQHADNLIAALNEAGKEKSDAH